MKCIVHCIARSGMTPKPAHASSSFTADSAVHLQQLQHFPPCVHSCISVKNIVPPLVPHSVGPNKVHQRVKPQANTITIVLKCSLDEVRVAFASFLICCCLWLSCTRGGLVICSSPFLDTLHARHSSQQQPPLVHVAGLSVLHGSMDMGGSHITCAQWCSSAESKQEILGRSVTPFSQSYNEKPKVYPSFP